MNRASLSPFPCQEHTVDVAVIGGGLAGLSAALAAARQGASVALMHDRPVLGGNASSECRMHVCGADRSGALPHCRETGILEELRLNNLYRNPGRNFSIWDLVLYDAAIHEPRLMLLLNCTCQRVDMDGTHIRSVTGWQLTTQTYHIVSASVFIDCSGDSILAPLTGARFRSGRESRSEFGESIAPLQADQHTMGMTCMFQARKTDTPQRFSPPDWAHRFTSCSDLPYGARGHAYWDMGYWWIELGGTDNTILDTERLRYVLLRITLGVWDHIKNSGQHDADTWALEWIQFLPAKRESRRYIGPYILTQNDIEMGGHFDDVIAFGGWPMDDHDTAGFGAVACGRPATIFHPAPSPYGIPYRTLYSINIDNLMFAGRNISCTHTAMSSTRVMGTCSVLGQAAGTAAALAVKSGLLPGNLGPGIGKLQSLLMEDDCYLPGLRRSIPETVECATLVSSQGDPSVVRDGINRQIGDHPHAWECPRQGWIQYTFEHSMWIQEIRLVLDSGMDQLIAMVFADGYSAMTGLPDVMPRNFRIDILREKQWRLAHEVTENHQRLVRVQIQERCEGLRFTLIDTWGASASRLYEFTFR